MGMGQLEHGMEFVIQWGLTLRAPWVTLVNKNFLPLSATGDFSLHEERAAYRHVKHWPLSALVA